MIAVFVMWSTAGQCWGHTAGVAVGLGVLGQVPVPRLGEVTPSPALFTSAGTRALFHVSPGLG